MTVYMRHIHVGMVWRIDAWGHIQSNGTVVKATELQEQTRASVVQTQG